MNEIPQDVSKYIRRIRNDRKRGYALEYANYILGNGSYPSHPGRLSYMAIQSVRLNIDRLTYGKRQ
jgi:hypothetical protein